MWLKKLIIVIMLYISPCMAQNDNIKSFLFLSIFCEESDSYYEQSGQTIIDFQHQYETFSYWSTNPLVIPVDTILCDSLKDHEKYSIQLFKIQRNTFIPPYYILRVISCDTYRFSFPEELWIRICGYRESDLKVFFDALRKQGMKKRDIIDMVNQWRNSDEMFCELDWDCLMEGYFKNKTCYSCYISGANIYYKARYGGRESDIYSDFSKKTLSGTLQELD